MFTVLSFVSTLLFLAIYLFKLTQLSTIRLGMASTTGFWFVFILLGVIGTIACYYLSQKEEKNPLKYITFFTPKVVLTLFFFYFLARFATILLPLGLIAGCLPVLYDAIRIKDDPGPYKAYVNGTDIEVDDGIVEHEAQPGDFVIGEIYKKNEDEDGDTPEGEDEYVPSGKMAVLPLGDRFLHMLVLGVTGTGKTSQTLLPMVLQDFLSDDFHFKGIDVVQMGQIILEPKGDFAKSAWAIGKIHEKEKRANYIQYLMTADEKLDTRIEKLRGQKKRMLDRQKPQPLSKEEENEFQLLTTLFKDKGKAFDKLSAKEKKERRKRLIALRLKKEKRELTREEKEELKIINESLKKMRYVRKSFIKVVPYNDFEKLNKLTTHAMFKYASLLSDMTYKPAEALEAWEAVRKVDKKKERDVFMLFDPMSQDSPYFNPLSGPEDTAVGTVASTLVAFMEDSSDYFKNLALRVAQDAIRMVKRVHGDDANLLHVNDVLNNNGGRGEEMVSKLLSLDTTAEKQSENRDIADYFTNTYYPGMKNARGASRDYEQSSGLRNNLLNLLDNARVRRVLNPPSADAYQINFDEILMTGDKVAISTATGGSDRVGKMLGTFIILQLQEAIFRRKGKDGQRVPIILYIDEFQDYASDSFEKVLTQGRSYAVSSTMATQTLGIVEQRAGRGLVSNLQSNARNVIAFPGGSPEDAKYFVSLFGSVDKKEVNRSISQEVKEDPKGLNKLFGQIAGEEGGGSGPRESVSERVSQIDRFTISHVIYGPNYKNQKIGVNDAFGYIYYRIVIKNSVQVPAVALIKWIPQDIKKRSDELIETYDSIIEIQNKAADTPVEDTGLDLLEKEKAYTGKKKRKKKKVDVVTDDPQTKARDKEGVVEFSEDVDVVDLEAELEEDEAMNSLLEDYDFDFEDIVDI